MTKNFKMKILLLALAILLIFLAACSKAEQNKKGPDVPAQSQKPVSEKAEPQDKGSTEQEPGKEEQAQEEQQQEQQQQEQGEEEQKNEEWEIPTLDISIYKDHEGVVFLLAYVELIKAQRYSEAAKYFTPSMVEEISEYGYENPEKYLKDIFNSTIKGDISLALYEVNDEYIVSGITRTDGTTPFSASLEANKWVLNFSPLN